MEHVRAVPEHPAMPARPWYYPESLKPAHSGSSSPRMPPCPSMRRSRTAAAAQDPAGWRHAAKAYARVAALETEIAAMARENDDTVRWVRAQQAQRDRRALWGYHTDVLADDAGGADWWGARRRRPAAAACQVEMDWAIQEELRRLQAQRRETARCRAAYERRKAVEEERERQRRMRREGQREAAEAAAWDHYEARWNELLAGDETGPLTFDAVPWPLVAQPQGLEDIRPARITIFVLSSRHSHGQTMKDRVRAALRRWHPDRFGRILSRVVEEDKHKVEEGAGIVVRCLNELLERSG